MGQVGIVVALLQVGEQINFVALQRNVMKAVAHQENFAGGAVVSGCCDYFDYFADLHVKDWLSIAFDHFEFEVQELLGLFVLGNFLEFEAEPDLFEAVEPEPDICEVGRGRCDRGELLLGGF